MPGAKFHLAFRVERRKAYIHMTVLERSVIDIHAVARDGLERYEI